jgi:hypothetical protein
LATKVWRRENKRAERAFALWLFGNQCEQCGFDDPRALCFDHIENDGAAHRAMVGPNAAQWILAHLTEAARRLQILCWNCNQIKRVAR